MQRGGKRVRLWARKGYGWSNHFPLITEVALCNRNTSFFLDARTVRLGLDGISDFNVLHNRKPDAEVKF